MTTPAQTAELRNAQTWSAERGLHTSGPPHVCQNFLWGQSCQKLIVDKIWTEHGHLAFNFDPVGIWLPCFYEHCPPTCVHLATRIHFWALLDRFTSRLSTLSYGNEHLYFTKQRLCGLLPLRYCSSLLPSPTPKLWGIERSLNNGFKQMTSDYVYTTH